MYNECHTGFSVNRIFDKYKERLIDVSTKNRALLFRSINKRTSYDLVEIPNIQDDLETWLFARNDKPFVW